MNWLSHYADLVYCSIRFLIGLTFTCHGGDKIFHSPPRPYGPATNALTLTTGWIELGGDFLIGFGFLTRFAAFICSDEMPVAYFMTSFAGTTSHHSPTIMDRLLPIMNYGEFPVTLCLVFFFLLRTRMLEH
jgi:putative oxidoreductase